MTTIPNTTTVDERDERKRKRAAILKFSLAGAAVLGIGAAATSAAWTDDAWFLAQGSAGTDAGGVVELEGRVAGQANWVQADSDIDAIEFGLGADVDGFAGMAPGETREMTIELRNASSEAVSLEVTEQFTKVTDGIFANAEVTTSFNDGGTEVLAQNATTTVTVTVTAPVTEWLTNPALGGKEVEGTIGTLTYTGTVVTS